MTHKIAIIITKYSYADQYGDDDYRIIDSITNWEEVSDQEFKSLKAMENKLGYHVIEQPADTSAFVKKTVSDYKAYVQAEEKRLAEEKEKRDKAALERKLKKEMKDTKSKSELLARLVKELGPDAVKSVLPK